MADRRTKTCSRPSNRRRYGFIAALAMDGIRTVTPDEFGDSQLPSQACTLEPGANDLRRSTT
jgi:hypothetical protein